MKKLLPVVIAAVVVSVAVWFVFQERRPTIPLTIGDTTIKVEVSKTQDERNTGLSGRTTLRENRGMLYVFDKQDFHVFSAKGMLFPFDIIWINKDKVVVDVMEEVQPESYPEFAYVNDFLAQYVLEVNAGFFKKHNLKLRDSVGFSLENLDQK